MSNISEEPASADVMVEPPVSSERRRARLDFIHSEGTYWAEIHKEDFDKLEDRTAVIINIVNGEYVTASTPLEAHDKFSQKFGENNTFGYSFEVNYPIFIGGGVV